MMTESEWRSLSRVNAPKPDYPELIPGLIAENALRLLDYHERLVYYIICHAERMQFGIQI